jgi:uncharacterized protein (TIGR03437 family)
MEVKVQGKRFSRAVYFRLFVSAAALFVGLSFAVYAQSDNQWRPLAPLEGGTVLALLNESGRVYAGTDRRGVFFSTNGGKNWQEANQGLGNVTVYALAAAGGSILAGTQTGIFRSINQGLSWTPVGANGLVMRALAVRGNNVFAGASMGRIFSSNNSGQTWAERTAVPNALSLNALAVLGENLFAGTARGVYRSSDQGQSWAHSSAGLPRSGEPNVYTFAVNGNSIYLGTEIYCGNNACNGAAPQVYVSNNNGQSWAGIGTGIVMNANPGSGYSAVAALGFDGTTLLALNSFGVAAYNGQRWVEYLNNSGLPVRPQATAIARHLDTFLLGTEGGVFTLARGEQSWKQSNAGLTAAKINALAVNNTSIFASVGPAGLFRSDNNGQSWERVSGIATETYPPYVVELLAATGRGVFAYVSSRSVFYSKSNGTYWAQANLGFDSAPGLNDFAVSGDEVYALSQPYVYRFDDGGEFWQTLNQVPLSAARLAVTGQTIYVAMEGGVARSKDSGKTFVQTNIANFQSPQALAARGSNVYANGINVTGAIPYPAQTFVSLNEGQSFAPAQTKLWMGAFAFLGNLVFAKGPGIGVFYSNNGSNWTPVNQGLPNRVVTSLAARGDTLFAGTEGSGVFAAINPHLQAGALSNVSAASFHAELAGGAIGSIFGSGLAALSQAATTLPLPTTLAGTRVVMRDNAGVEREARLFFVSPTQINYEVPPGTLPGNATVIVFTQDNAAFGNVLIANVAPGLFAANANGQGLAAAIALRVKADGSQTYESIMQYDAGSNRFIARPLSLGPESDQVFLLLFGTGFRARSSLTAVTARIGGLDAPVTYAGAQGSLSGLDQANVRVPRALAGRGEVEISLTVDGKAANPVRVNFR